MDRAKYIVIEKMGTETPIVFPCWMEHKEIAGERAVISAGTVQFGIKITQQQDDGEDWKTIDVCCFGESTSCRNKDGKPIQSRGEEDAWLIEKSVIC